MTLLRPISIDDLDEIDRIYFDYSGRGVPRYLVIPSLSNYPSVIAEIDGIIAAFAYCLHFAPDVVELGNIFIRPDARNRGLGGEMVKMLEGSLIPPQRYIIAVNSDLSKTVVMKRHPGEFYRKLGFQIISQTESSTVYWKDTLV